MCSGISSSGEVPQNIYDRLDAIESRLQSGVAVKAEPREPAPAHEAPKPQEKPTVKAAEAAPVSEAPLPEAPAEPDLPDGPFNNWSEVLEALQTFDIPLYGILANSNAEIKNGRVIINSDNPTLFDFICTDTHSKELARAVYKVIGKRMKIAVANKEKPKAQAESPLEELKKKINDFNNGG